MQRARNMAQPDLTEVEVTRGFVLPETVDVPPCGDVFPDGNTLALRRIHDGAGLFAMYVGEAGGERRMTQAMSLCVTHDSDLVEREDEALVYASLPEEIGAFVNDAVPGLFDDLQGADDGNPPTGSSPAMLAGAEAPSKLAKNIAMVVAETAYLQAAARQAALITIERNKTRSPPARSGLDR